jgi:hypothetical protein
MIAIILSPTIGRAALKAVPRELTLSLPIVGRRLLGRRRG